MYLQYVKGLHNSTCVLADIVNGLFLHNSEMYVYRNRPKL